MDWDILVVHILEPLSEGTILSTYGQWSYIREHWQPWKWSWLKSSSDGSHDCI